MSELDKGKADVAALRHKIDAIIATIGPIVEANAESEKAHADKLAAQIDLVSTMLQLAQPTVRAIGTRPTIWQSNGDHSSRANQLATWRGLVLTCPVKEIRSSNSEPAPLDITGAPDDAGYSKGMYGGSHVFLSEHGELVKLSYTGAYHVVRGGQDEWRASEQRISTEDFCRDHPSAADPKKLAAQLLGFMEKAGDRRKSIAKARELADKYRAIATLL